MKKYSGFIILLISSSIFISAFVWVKTDDWYKGLEYPMEFCGINRVSYPISDKAKSRLLSYYLQYLRDFPPEFLQRKGRYAGFLRNCSQILCVAEGTEYYEELQKTCDK